MRLVIAFIGAAIAVGTAPANLRAAGSPAPTAVIQQTVDDVLAVLRDSSLSETQRRQRIEEIAYARFDGATTSRLVLARNWKRFSAEQRVAFQEEFERYLAATYGSRIDRYSNESVEIVGERVETRGDVTVRTRIVGGQFDAAVVDYRLRQRDGQWRVIDVIIEGISLISNYRDQFKEVLARGGPERLLERLRQKNAEAAIPPPSASAGG
jgi:phospholipid transport system substrate-binding protein